MTNTICEPKELLIPAYTRNNEAYCVGTGWVQPVLSKKMGI